jgi:hypothetical protein
LPACCSDISAAAMSRFCTILRQLRMCKAQRVTLLKEKLAGVDCRLPLSTTMAATSTRSAAGMRAKEFEKSSSAL